MSNRYFKVMEAYFKNSDIARNNANFVRSINNLAGIIVGEVMKDYQFDVLYKGLPTKDIHNEGWAYLHQTFLASPYCIGLSSKDIAMFGIQSNAKNERSAKPPKRLETFFMQSANLICLIAQEVSGATSLNDLATIGAGYLYHLEKTGKKQYSHYDLKNIWQEFLFNVNLPFRTGNNSPFSNITLEFGKPNPHLAEEYVVFGGNPIDIKYKEIPEDYYNRMVDAFIDAMSEGDSEGRPFTFPLITVNLYPDFDWDNKIFKKLLEKSDYFGGLYFQNYQEKPFKEGKYVELNKFIEPFDIGMIYSNCCRMTFDISDVVKYTGSNPFHSNSGVGGIGVYNINMNRLLFLAKDDFELFTYLFDYIFEVGVKTLQRKRQFIREHWEDLFPYLSYYQKTDKSLFNIFSVVGVHEGLINAGFKDGLKGKEGKEYGLKLANYIREKIEKAIEETGELFSLEYAPSENAACKLAEKDIAFARKCYEMLQGKKEVLSKDKVLDDKTKFVVETQGEKLFTKIAK